MAKQNVFNFKTMQFELVECDDLLSLIDNLNAECAAQPRVQPTLLTLCPYCERVHDNRLACPEYVAKSQSG